MRRMDTDLNDDNSSSRANDKFPSGSPDNSGDHFVSESNYEELLSLGQCIGCHWTGNYNPCDNPTTPEDVEACKKLQALLEKEGKFPKRPSGNDKPDATKKEETSDQKSIKDENESRISDNVPPTEEILSPTGEENTPPSAVARTDNLDSGPNSQRASESEGEQLEKLPVESNMAAPDSQGSEQAGDFPPDNRRDDAGLSESYKNLQSLNTCDCCEWNKNYHPCENPKTEEDWEICRKYQQAQQQNAGKDETVQNEDVNDPKNTTEPDANSTPNESSPPPDVENAPITENKSPGNSPKNSVDQPKPPSGSKDSKKTASKPNPTRSLSSLSTRSSHANLHDHKKSTSHPNPTRSLSSLSTRSSHANLHDDHKKSTSKPNPSRSLSALSTDPSHTNIYDERNSTTRILSQQAVAGNRKSGKYFALQASSGVLKDLEGIQARSMGSIYHTSKSKHVIDFRKSSQLDLDRSKSNIGLPKSSSRASNLHFHEPNKSITRLKSANGIADLSTEDVLAPVKPNHDNGSPAGSAVASAKNSVDDIHHKIFDQHSTTNFHPDIPPSDDNTPRHSNPNDTANSSLSPDNPVPESEADNPKPKHSCGKNPDDIPDRPLVTESIYEDLLALGKCSDCSWTKNYHPCFEKGDTSGLGPLGDCAQINDYYPEEDSEPYPPRSSEPKHYGCYDPKNDESGERNKMNPEENGETHEDYPTTKKSSADPSDATEAAPAKPQSKKNSAEDPDNENVKKALLQEPRQSQGHDDITDADDSGVETGAEEAGSFMVYVSKSTYEELLAKGKLLDPPSP